MLKTFAHKKTSCEVNPHEAKVCISATYNAGNDSETVHTNNAEGKILLRVSQVNHFLRESFTESAHSADSPGGSLPA